MGCSQKLGVRGQRSHTTACHGYDGSDVDREVFITSTLSFRRVAWDTENQTRHQATWIGLFENPNTARAGPGDLALTSQQELPPLQAGEARL